MLNELKQNILATKILLGKKQIDYEVIHSNLQKLKKLSAKIYDAQRRDNQFQNMHDSMNDVGQAHILPNDINQNDDRNNL